jgi:hypothetical protein
MRWSHWTRLTMRWSSQAQRSAPLPRRPKAAIEDAPGRTSAQPKAVGGGRRAGLVAVVLGLGVALAACDRERGAEPSNQNDGPLCWQNGTTCVTYLDTAKPFDALVSAISLPLDDAGVTQWEQSFESLDGAFDFIGTSALSPEAKREGLTYLLEHQALIVDLYRIIDAEVRATAPVFLARNTPEQLARIQVVLAPFLQRTNGSVGATADGQIMYLLGVDRLAFNITEVGLDETWVRSVVAHEMVHASHFASSTYATSARNDPPLARKLWVEGLAMWGSAHAGPTKYTLREVFGEAYATTCEAQSRALEADYLRDLGNDTLLNFAVVDLWWNQDEADPRGYGLESPGYCVGLKLVEALAEKHSFEALLQLAPAEAYALAREQLEALGP